jgi:hypothetical protein
MRTWLVLAFAVLVASPVFADPPSVGYVGAISLSRGKEENRFSCDSLSQIQQLYKASQRNYTKMKAVFSRLNKKKSIVADRENACKFDTYETIEVVRYVSLGPIPNPTGKDKLFAWAILVNDKPDDDAVRYWLLFIDKIGEQHEWLRSGTPA